MFTFVKTDFNNLSYSVFEFGAGEALCSLFADCYSWEDFCEWLIEHDLDIAQDFRFSNRKTYEEIVEEVDNGEDNPEGTYNLDTEGWDNHYEYDGEEFGSFQDLLDYVNITDEKDRKNNLKKTHRKKEDH